MISRHSESGKIEVEHRFFLFALSVVFLAQTNDRPHGLGVEAGALGLGKHFLDVVAYPSLRLVGDSSLEYRAEPYMAQITYGSVDADTAHANARLIAAAPDLLAMLKVAQLWLDVDGRYDMQGINATIAKAEGRSS